MKKYFVCFILLLFCMSVTQAAFAADNVPVESISLDQQEAVIQVGKTLKLKADIQPKNASAKKPEWSSSDESIATVKNGSVKAVAPGECTISCKAADDSNAEASCRIQVIQPVKKLSFKEKNVRVAVESSQQLTPVISPENASNQTLEWTSSDESVCTVSADGTVTGVAEGKCTVTCVTTDGTEKKASITIDSVIPAPPITFMEIPWGSNLKDALSASGLELTDNDKRMWLEPTTFYLTDLSAEPVVYGSAQNDGDFLTGKYTYHYNTVLPEFMGYQTSDFRIMFAYSVRDGKVVIHADDCRLIAGSYGFSSQDGLTIKDAAKVYTDYYTKLYGKPEKVKTDDYVRRTTGFQSCTIWTDDYGNRVGILGPYSTFTAMRLCFFSADANKYLAEVSAVGDQPDDGIEYHRDDASSSSMRLDGAVYPELCEN